MKVVISVGEELMSVKWYRSSSCQLIGQFSSDVTGCKSVVMGEVQSVGICTC